MLAAVAQRAQCGQRVRRLAGLADQQAEAAAGKWWGAVAELAGDVGIDRQPGLGLDPAARDEAGVECRAAGGDRCARQSGQVEA